MLTSSRSGYEVNGKTAKKHIAVYAESQWGLTQFVMTPQKTQILISEWIRFARPAYAGDSGFAPGP